MEKDWRSRCCHFLGKTEDMIHQVRETLKGQEWKFDQNKLQIVQNLWAEKTEIELFFEN